MSDGTPGNQSSQVSFERERGVYALEVMHDVAHAVISVGDDVQRTARILQVFHVLAAASVPIFLIKMHRRAVTLAFAGANREHAEQALAAAGLKAEVRGELALLAVRAASMRDLHGIMVVIADALFEAGARLYETGDSHNSVQCLIKEDRVPDAVAQLCRTFQLEPDAVQQFSMDAEGAS